MVTPLAFFTLLDFTCARFVPFESPPPAARLHRGTRLCLRARRPLLRRLQLLDGLVDAAAGAQHRFGQTIIAVLGQFCLLLVVSTPYYGVLTVLAWANHAESTLLSGIALLAAASLS